MSETEPLYIHNGTGFMEGLQIEDRFDSFNLYAPDPAIGYFQARLNSKE